MGCAPRSATPSNCWKLLKPLHTKERWKHRSGQGNDLGYGDNCSGCGGPSPTKMDNQQPSPNHGRGSTTVEPPPMHGCSSQTTWRWAVNANDGLRYSRPLPRGSQQEDPPTWWGELVGHCASTAQGNLCRAETVICLQCGTSGSLRLNLTQHGKTYQVQT